MVQARMGSTRLAGKSMKLLAGKPLVYHVLERTRAIRGVAETVLVTGRGKENFPLIELAEKSGCSTYAGSEEDVLDRFFRAAEKFPCSHIVRVTGDNPFTDIGYAGRTVDTALESHGDITALTGLPLGTAVEIIRFEALARAHQRATKPHEREHVSPYIKERPHEFKIVHIPSGFQNPFPDLRLTVDTDEDFILAEKIYSALYHGSQFDVKEVISFVAENRELTEINRHIEQRSMHHSGKK